MYEFLSSPYGPVTVGLVVLAVAVVALCVWIVNIDRRMRGMADGLEAERRKVAEMQMIIGRRNNAARSYGNRSRTSQPAAAPAPAPARQPAQQAYVPPTYPPQGAASAPAGNRQMPPQAGAVAPMPQQPVFIPDKKMTRKERRDAERAFAERAAAELEARKQRRAQQAAAQPPASAPSREDRAQQGASAPAYAAAAQPTVQQSSAAQSGPVRGRHAR